MDWICVQHNKTQLLCSSMYYWTDQLIKIQQFSQTPTVPYWQSFLHWTDTFIQVQYLNFYYFCYFCDTLRCTLSALLSIRINGLLFVICWLGWRLRGGLELSGARLPWNGMKKCINICGISILRMGILSVIMAGLFILCARIGSNELSIMKQTRSDYKCSESSKWKK